MPNIPKMQKRQQNQYILFHLNNFILLLLISLEYLVNYDHNYKKFLHV